MFKLLAFALLVSGTSAFWRACTDRPGALPPDHATSPSCDTEKCTATRGQPLEADIYMTSPRSYTELRVRVTAYIFGIGVNLPQDPPYDNACNSLWYANEPNRQIIPGCPTAANTQAIWRLSMTIPATYPAFQSTRVRFELLEGQAVVGCSEITATLV